MMKRLLLKNPFLAFRISKKTNYIRIIEIMYKIGLFSIYFLLKPLYLKKEKNFFRQFECNHILRLENRGISFYLPNLKWTDSMINGEYLQQIIYYSKDYYEYNTLKYIKNMGYLNGTILDIGANIGNHTIFFACECGAKKVYSFEPAKYTFSILEKNIELNGLKKVVELYNLAVGSTVGNARIVFQDRKNLGSTRITYERDGDIRLCSIDQLGIKGKIDFVKIDIEGYELEALKGMEKIIERDTPIFFVEIWQDNFEDVNAFFKKQNYELQWKNGDNYLYKSNVSNGKDDTQC